MVIPDDAPDVISIVVGIYDSGLTEIMRIGMAESPTLQTSINPTPQASFGMSLHVGEFRYPTHLNSGERLTIQADWFASTPVHQDYIWFVHILDDAGNLVGQSDEVILTDQWTTSALVPGYTLQAARTISLNDGIADGVYRIYTGLYRWPSLERLPVYNTDGNAQADNRLMMGEITVGVP